MVERLRAINERMDVRLNPYESERRAELYGRLAEAETRPPARLELLRQHAVELLNAGHSREAIERLAEVTRGEEAQGVNDPGRRRQTRILEATAWLRLGEQVNCISNHTTESCLLPIQGGGVHRFQEGSREGIRILLSLLAEEPDRLDARWLLNVAFMTIGEYPDGVPERWRIPPERFASDYDIKRFTDVAGDLGVDNNAVSGATVVDDFNNDGHLDILVTGNHLSEQMRLYVSRGDGSFEDRTAAAGLTGLTGGLNALQADYDNDGFVDVLVLRGAWMSTLGRLPNSLLHNNGDGTFSDVTFEAGLRALRPTQTAAFFDYNGDGLLDLLVGNESDPRARHRLELFRNQGNGTFTDCSLQSGIRVFEFIKGLSVADYNNDGRPDFVLSILGAPNQLWRNDGPAPEAAGNDAWRFTEVSAQSGIGPPLDSFPCWFFDYDNDGWEDLFFAGYSLVNMDDTVAGLMGFPPRGPMMRLFRNRGDGTFEDVSVRVRLQQSILAMGANFGDLDNDGFLDFYIGTGNPDLRALVPNKMYRNAGGEFFQDVTTSGGFGHLQKGHAIAFADLDNDGDQDVYANLGGAFTGDVYRNALFANPGHGNHWITLQLEGVRSNRSAIGARIKVVLESAEGNRTVFKTVNSGGSFGANPLRQGIGLGRATAIDRVEIFWPTTGRTQVLRDLALDHAYQVREDSGTPTPLALPPAPFKASADHGHHH